VSINADLSAQVNSWLAQDPDPITRTELETLFSAAQTDSDAAIELADAFSAPLEFGTAGLRGPLGAGPNRMNRVTVLQAAAGLSNYLLAHGFAGKPVVIGFDARYNSEVFARDTAAVMAGAGLKPKLFSHVVPTPVLAYSIRNQGACAGVMVTASHNPPQDNGYKVYMGDGRQIVAPADTEISNYIKSVEDVRVLSQSLEIEILSLQVIQNYVSVTSQLVAEGPTQIQQRQNITSVYTAMHGVGWHTLQSVVTAAGFSEPISVPEQRDPDPAFPTVAFPNPEEKGALDLAFDLAAKKHVDVLLANDPDADRLAVALPTATGWKALRGDQIGALLGWWLIERQQMVNQKLNGTFANSIVSSMLLEPIAKAAGLNYENTLTGFKWVSRVENLVFGYEEALGYCVDPNNVSDKDGISAALVFLELVSELKHRNQTAWEVLDQLALAHGLHVTDQVSVRVTDLQLVATVMTALRTNPPTKLGNLTVAKIDDLATGIGKLPNTDAIVINLSGNNEIAKARVIIRPSGTEPKVKCYLEVVAKSDDLAIAQQSADNELQALARDAAPLLEGGK
jgi:phosphomannomutase